MNSAIRYLLLIFALSNLGTAQIIQVDVTPGHVRKSFVPNQALGAGIDRITEKMIDGTFVKPVIDRVLEAGWAR